MTGFKTLSNKEVIAWHTELSYLIDTLSQDDFCATLCTMLNKLVAFEAAAIITYKKNHEPLFIYDSYSRAEHDEIIGKYLDGIFILDPFYTAFNQNIESGIYRLKELAPDSFDQSDYYKKYYRNLNNIYDEIGVFIDISDDEMMIISLARGYELQNITLRERNLFEQYFSTC